MGLHCNSPPFSILAPSIACLNINKKQENEKTLLKFLQKNE
jgi:hypothetical protein